MYPKESASDFLQDLIFKVGGFQEGDGLVVEPEKLTRW